jgi:KaiC/GvpD/RAD55 family RecA-like ATPase
MSIDPTMLAAAIAAAMKQQSQAQQPADEWIAAEEPMKIDLQSDISLGDLESKITKPDATMSNHKKLIGFKTGTLLDDLFLDNEQNPINGVPKVAQIAITGLAGAGKSILVEEIAIKCAFSGEKVLLVTSEDMFRADNERFDLQSRMMDKARILGLDWTPIKDNLYVLDAVNNSDLRHWKDFAETYRYACKKYKITVSLIDSVTMLEDTRGQLKYRLMELCRFNQENGITSIMVNQRAQEEWDKYGMAGGHAIAHEVDGTVLVDYGRPYHADQKAELGKGEIVRMVRVMDMRLCGFKRERIPVDISPDGFLRKISSVPAPFVPKVTSSSK